ncbi:MAG: hypothetical protein WCP06_11550 [Verrucomicrobiota bacterium]
MITAFCRPKAAFSLVEVTLALGIAAFCLITAFGLLPIGLTSNRNSTEQTAASRLATAVIADLRATPPAISGAASSQSPVFQIEIPAPSSSAQIIRHVYFAEDGSSTSAGAATARYLVSIGMTPPPIGRRSATLARILVTWPATSVPNGQWPSQYSGFFEALTALNRN